MATMIPPEPRRGAPSGELKVYESLRDHPETAGWVVWHGLPIRRLHPTQIEGEADFVVLVPGEGMLVIEVKSHERIEVDDDGRWRLGNQPPTDRSPYDQAAENRHSIIEWFRRRAFDPHYPVWHAAWFPNRGGELVKQLEARIDVPAGSTLTRADLDPARIASSIVRVLHAGEQAVRANHRRFQEGRPDAHDIAEARITLTPTISWERATAERRAAREADLHAATERQEEALRYFAAHDRLLITGPAGTGKTNVAVRAAQLQANRDERVLLTCFNKLLDVDLQQRLRSRGDITVARVHQLMLAYSGLTPPPDAGDAWWNGTLPEATLAVTRAPGFEPPFTCLVADEAQDLVRDSTLDVLDSLLVDGLAGSRVVLAGDFTRQDIYKPRDAAPVAATVAPSVEETATAALRHPEPAPRRSTRLETIAHRLPGAVTMTLENNVRQSPQLAELIELMLHTEFYIGFDRDFDDEPGKPPLRIHRYGSEAEQQQQLNDTLIALWEDGWEPHEILILSPRRASAATRAQGAVADALARHDSDASGTPWGTVHAYKGLEAPVVVLTDVDGSTPQWEDLLYIGATRATERLIVLTSLDEIAERASLWPSS